MFSLIVVLFIYGILTFTIKPALVPTQSVSLHTYIEVILRHDTLCSRMSSSQPFGRFLFVTHSLSENKAITLTIEFLTDRLFDVEFGQHDILGGMIEL